MWRSLLALLVVAACVRSDARQCGDHLCPSGTRCGSYLDLDLCLTPEQLDACAGQPDRHPCDAGFAGTCYDGQCLPIGCGNGRIDDPLFRTGEQCDDGGRQSHDGCSSTCQLEELVAEDLRFEPFERNAQLAMAFAASRGVITMFGGSGYGAGVPWPLFELDDAGWVSRRSAGFSPVPRHGTALAYDARRHTTVMFGGQRTTTTTLHNDTWEWDGTTWTFRPTPGPSPRVFHAMAYDARRGVTVLFGGTDGTTPLGDTWEWDGVDWQEVPVVSAPAPRARHALVYDPGRGVIVMIGEVTPGIVETWEYDGTWRDVTGVTRPPSASEAIATYDGVAREILVAGGAGPSDGTWAYDGAAWVMRSSSVPVGTHVEGAAAAMDLSGRPVSFGGRASADPATAGVTTSRWDGATWTPLAPRLVEAPEIRHGPGVALDVHRNRIVLFGGQLATVGDSDELWELDRSGWQRRTVMSGPTPTARSGHAMAYDAARRVTVMMGGSAVDDQTWLWDGERWRAVPATPTDWPPALVDASMTYDAANRRIVMFGGRVGTIAVDDTWSWDGATWKRIASPLSPTARFDAAMAYDPIRRTVLLFGGNRTRVTPLDDTWELDGDTWTQLAPQRAPRGGAWAMAWDAAQRRLVLVNGGEVWAWDEITWTLQRVEAGVLDTTGVAAFDGAGVITLESGPLTPGAVQRTRRYWMFAPTAYETCSSAGDHDLDGLIGCDDPDCWASCAPTCPPGSEPCDPVQPRCGDGVCDPLESCWVCPGDCGACPAVCGDFVCAPGEDCVGDCTP